MPGSRTLVPTSPGVPGASPNTLPQSPVTTQATQESKREHSAPPPPPIAIATGAENPLYVQTVKGEFGWSDAISGLSLCLSLVSIFLTMHKSRADRIRDEAARTKSIDDDFWLRSVVYPLVTEPLVAFLNKASMDLPCEATNPAATEQAVASYRNDFESKLREVNSKLFVILKTHRALYMKYRDVLEKAEDEVTEYLSEHSNGYQPQITPVKHTRNEAEVILANLIGEILSAFKSAQQHVNSGGPKKVLGKRKSAGSSDS